MKLIEFADKYNLKVMKLEGELAIPGRKLKQNDGRYPAPNPRHPLDCMLGHIFEYSSTRMGLVFMPRRPKLWTMLRKKMLAAGFEIRQNGDWEGTATFDPADSAQARLAIDVIGARKKRQATEAQLKNLARLRTLITSSNPSIKPPLASVESLETSRGIEGVGGLVESPKPSIKPPIAALESAAMAGVLPKYGPTQVQA
jgi:hypothetical protein